jgi:hypothetical protein
MLSMFKPLAVVAVAASALALGQPAHATVITYTYNDYVGSGTPPSGPYGTVELNDNGGSNVAVTVTLASGEGFVNTGAGESLAWDLFGTTTPQPSQTITGLTSGFSFNVNGTGLHTGGAGDWDYAITCVICGNGGSSPYTGTLSFTINDVSLSDFVPNLAGFTFASDICTSVNATTGKCNPGALTGNVTASSPNASVPEPATLALFAAGLGALGFALGRRRTKSASK